MSNSKKNIADKFSRFEPDVDDATISAGWEKIKYFLPEEKKRRGFIFFKTLGFKISAITFCILLVTLAVLNDNEPVAEPKIKNRVDNLEPANKRERESEESKSAQNKNKYQPKQSHNSQSKTTNYPIAAKSAPKVNVRIKTRVPSTIQVSAEPSLANITENSVAKESFNELPAKSTENSNSVESEFPQTNGRQITVNSETDFPALVPELPANKDSEAFVKLEPLPIIKIPQVLNEDSVQSELVFMKKIYSPDAPKKKTLSLEFLGGLNQAYSHIVYGEGGEAKVGKTANLTGGIGAVFQFNDKWNVNGNFIVNGNKLDYNEKNEETLGNKIVRKNVQPGSAVSGFVDTTIMYVQVHSVNTLTSKLNYNFQFGLGYTLMKKQRYSLEAFAQFCARSTGYGFTSENYQDTDTLLFTKTNSSGPLPNQVKTSEKYFKADYTVTSFGLVPGITFAYRLTSKLSLVLKPSYFYQLSKSTLNPEGKFFALRQNNLFLNFGMRVKL